jgi:hypothetical protein
VHPCWAPYILVQVHNPIAAELHYFDHCYQEHLAFLPPELTLFNATKKIVNEILSSATDTLYIVLLFYNKKEYNLNMANIGAETCSCW